MFCYSDLVDGFYPAGGTRLRPDPTVNQNAVIAEGRKFLLLEPQKDYLETTR